MIFSVITTAHETCAKMYTDEPARFAEVVITRLGVRKRFEQQVWSTQTGCSSLFTAPSGVQSLPRRFWSLARYGRPRLPPASRGRTTSTFGHATRDAHRARPLQGCPPGVNANPTHRSGSTPRFWRPFGRPYGFFALGRRWRETVTFDHCRARGQKSTLDVRPQDDFTCDHQASVIACGYRKVGDY